ncbi:hypothetical protein BS50DRAFT_105584 [Corynespora cassiicola Philippines]|uniref:Uncharacterized protein n=1 Tax=Corynespora cassiicola Philippines TaxID=1448308 RepID=A0A2T2NDQ1_CORCC|nr:hypothetical protein BS50DRAFT_105584 [Corynespora cassiicola Philippines]
MTIRTWSEVRPIQGGLRARPEGDRRGCTMPVPSPPCIAARLHTYLESCIDTVNTTPRLNTLPAAVAATAAAATATAYRVDVYLPAAARPLRSPHPLPPSLQLRRPSRAEISPTRPLAVHSTSPGSRRRHDVGAARRGGDHSSAAPQHRRPYAAGQEQADGSETGPVTRHEPEGVGTGRGYMTHCRTARTAARCIAVPPGLCSTPLSSSRHASTHTDRSRRVASAALSSTTPTPTC